MKKRKGATVLMATAFLAATGLAEAQDHKAAWSRMIECKASSAEYMGFVLDFQDEQEKKKLGVEAVQQPNSFISEYRLPSPVTVYNKYTTDKIAFTSSGVMAILDHRDAAALAKEQKLDIVMANDQKVLATKSVRKTKPLTKDGLTSWEEVTRDLSTVTTHPGKTLLGCSYRIVVN